MTDSKEPMMEKKAVIIGAGPAGLTAAFELNKAGVQSIVLEKDNIVGGISRTVQHKGYHFDIGGHRFFTKVKPVEDMWNEVLQKDFLYRQRLSRIYYNKKFFFYPLKPANALLNLGVMNAILILLSYFKAQIWPSKPEVSVEQWVANRFGYRLYSIFFKSYTEKVWGIPCRELSAEWAAQRIKGLSLIEAVKSALLKSQSKSKGEVIKTLIDAFHYPRKGPGLMWERVANIVRDSGSEVRLNTETVNILWDRDKVTGVRVKKDGKTEVVAGTHFISSMPVRELIQRLDPPAPERILEAANKLNYRDFLTVALVVNKPDLFPDNWIYIHDPEVKLGRIQNFKNWSPEMVPDQTKTCLGLEYFCFEGDGLWTMADEDLIALGKKELHKLGLADMSDIEDGAVVRMPKAYPVYDGGYAEALTTIREFLNQLPNLQLVGRNGMHKYNNQDHSMLTAMLAAKNVLGANYDLWGVNVDQEYHEEVQGEKKGIEDLARVASTQPRVPERVKEIV
jgi:protoporphyrinogen oxidase